MPTDDERIDAYADWIVKNKDKKGTPEFETVANSYKELRQSSASSSGPGMMDYASAGLSGFNRGLGSWVDLAAQGLDAVGLGSEGPPIGGTEWMRRQGIIQDQPDTPAMNFTGRVAEEIGASALPAGAILGKAVQTAKPVGQALGGLGDRIWQGFARPIANSPGMATLGETAAAAGAGAGASFARGVAPGDETAEMYGQVLGGLGPSAAMYLPGALGIRAGRAAWDKWFSPKAQEKAGREVVKEMMGQELTPEAQQSLDQAQTLRQRIEGFNPSLGEATGSPGLLAQQRRVENTASGQDLDRLVARRRGSEQAIDSFAQSRAPEGFNDPDIIIDTANGRINSLRSEIDRQTGVAQGRREDLAGSLPVADRSDIGEGLRERLLDQRQRAASDLGAQASRLGLDQVDLTEPFNTRMRAITDDLTQGSIFEDTANYPEVLSVIRRATEPDQGAPTGLLDASGNPIRRAPREKRITFQDVKLLRERITDDLIDATAAANPNRKKIRTLSILRKRVTETMDELLNAADPGLADRYRDFRQAYFDGYIDRFEKGAAFKVRQKDGRGFYRTPDEKVAETFFAPGRVSNARSYKRVFGNDPEAAAAMEATVLDSLRSDTVDKGVINPNKLRTWLRRHEDVLAEFPEIRRKVQSVESADAALLDRQAQLAGRRRWVEDRALTRELNAYGDARKTADQVIDAALRNPRRMSDLVQVLRRGPPEALNGLRRHIWDRAIQGGPEDLAAFLKDNRQSLKAVLGDSHVEALGDILQARMMLARSGDPTGAAYQSRPLAEVERMIGQGIPQLSSRVFAFNAGRMQKGYLVTETLMRGLRGRAQASADDLLRVALYDPAVARDMAEAVQTGTLRPETAQRLQARWFALAPTMAEDERQPTYTQQQGTAVGQ